MLGERVDVLVGEDSYEFLIHQLITSNTSPVGIVLTESILDPREDAEDENYTMWFVIVRIIDGEFQVGQRVFWIAEKTYMNDEHYNMQLLEILFGDDKLPVVTLDD